MALAKNCERGGAQRAPQGIGERPPAFSSDGLKPKPKPKPKLLAVVVVVAVAVLGNADTAVLAADDTVTQYTVLARAAINTNSKYKKGLLLLSPGYHVSRITAGLPRPFGRSARPPITITVELPRPAPPPRRGLRGAPPARPSRLLVLVPAWYMHPGGSPPRGRDVACCVLLAATGCCWLAQRPAGPPAWSFQSLLARHHSTSRALAHQHGH
jgi:hypothetical protein